MPSTKKIGSHSAANDAIGGVPTLHYFDFQSRGRGQVVRLLWEDAGIAYEDVRYSFEEFPDVKKNKISELNPTGNIPVVELNGKILTQSYAILRQFARLLGKYDGKNEEEKYWADAMCDIAIDCEIPLPHLPRHSLPSHSGHSIMYALLTLPFFHSGRTLFIQAFFSPNKSETYPEHQKTTRAHYLSALETHLKSNGLSQQGPYVIGKEITYADMVIYQICHDENLTQDGRKGLKDYPRLTKLVDALEGRENVKNFLESDRYLG